MAAPAAVSVVCLPQSLTSALAVLPVSRSAKRLAAVLPASTANRGCYRSERARYHTQYRRAVAFCPPPLKSW